MIIQWVIDWFASLVVAWVRGWPQPPGFFWDARNWLVSTGAQLGDLVEKFGVIVPFNAITLMLGAWLSVMTFWLGGLALRLILWAVNR